MVPDGFPVENMRPIMPSIAAAPSGCPNGANMTGRGRKIGGTDDKRIDAIDRGNRLEIVRALRLSIRTIRQISSCARCVPQT
jgi:hypothetical protein